MEPRRVLPSLRKSNAAPADCTRPLFGRGRNRHVSAAPLRANVSDMDGMAAPCFIQGPKSLLLYRTILASFGPDVPAASSYAAERPIFSLPIRSRRVLPSLRKSNAAPADCTHSLLGRGRNRHVSAAPFLYAASEKNVSDKTLLRAAANKSCAGSGPENLVAGAVAYHGKRVKRVFCAAVPIFNIPIIACWQNIVGADGTLAPRPVKFLANGNEYYIQNRQSANQKHRFTKGSTSTDGGTAVTNPTSRTGGTELRLFPSLDFSLRSKPANRQVQSSRRRIGAVRSAGLAAWGVLAHTSAPLISTHRPNHLYEPPRRACNVTGLRGGFPTGLFL